MQLAYLSRIRSVCTVSYFISTVFPQLEVLMTSTSNTSCTKFVLEDEYYCNSWRAAAAGGPHILSLVGSISPLGMVENVLFQ